MLQEGSRVIDEVGPTWDRDPSLDWRTVDRTLRGIACRRAARDALEARWLYEAERLQIWRPLGMVSALDYLERVLGYTPHVAKERLRVARALRELPALTDAFARGELAFSAVRELTRVATPETETRWRDAAAGKNVREIEDLVAGHRRGDPPDAPADPEARTHVVRLELGAEVFARLRQVRASLTGERGAFLDDDQLVTALCDAVLDRASDPGTEPTGRAKFQIAVTVCARCDRASQEAAGAATPIDEAALDRARCDAQHVGSIDGEVPERAQQDIPPSVVRFVWRRDGGRCQTPRLSLLGRARASSCGPPQRRWQPRSEQSPTPLRRLSSLASSRDAGDRAGRVRPARSAAPRRTLIEPRRQARRDGRPRAGARRARRPGLEAGDRAGRGGRGPVPRGTGRRGRAADPRGAAPLPDEGLTGMQPPARRPPVAMSCRPGEPSCASRAGSSRRDRASAPGRSRPTHERSSGATPAQAGALGRFATVHHVPATCGARAARAAVRCGEPSGGRAWRSSVAVMAMSSALASADCTTVRLVAGAVAVRRELADEIDPGLVRDPLDHVREVLALGDELDDIAGDDIADRDPPGTSTTCWCGFGTGTCRLFRLRENADRFGSAPPVRVAG